jgi:hypothetical protein
VSTVSRAVIQGEGPRRSFSSLASAGAQSASDVIKISGFGRARIPAGGAQDAPLLDC